MLAIGPGMSTSSFEQTNDIEIIYAFKSPSRTNKSSNWKSQPTIEI